MHPDLKGEHPAVDTVVDNVTGGIRVGVFRCALVKPAENRHRSRRSPRSRRSRRPRRPVAYDIHRHAQQVITPERHVGCRIRADHIIFVRILCHADRFRRNPFNAAYPRPDIAAIAAPHRHPGRYGFSRAIPVRHTEYLRIPAPRHRPPDLRDRRHQLHHRRHFAVLAEVHEQDPVPVVAPFAVREPARALVLVRERFADTRGIVRPPADGFPVRCHVRSDSRAAAQAHLAGPVISDDISPDVCFRVVVGGSFADILVRVGIGRGEVRRDV